MVVTHRPMSNIGFKFMCLMFKIRDFLQPRLDVLKEAGIESGFSVLDFGCGPGGHIMSLVELVGPSGKIHALDIHPLAIQAVEKMVTRKGIKNIVTIESDCNTGLPDNGLDTVLLYDVFHGLVHPDEVLRELHRILKPGGTLSFSDHHMKEEEILTRVTGAGMFRFVKKGNKTYSFAKPYSKDKV
jgi:ubiquinone/menaquinone biosynthesis C-methylase UbiE